MEEKNVAPDEFTILLRQFNKLVANTPPIDQIKADLEDIRQMAEASPELNLRQKEAILDRIKYYHSGEYGNTKNPEIMQAVIAQLNGKSK